MLKELGGGEIYLLGFAHVQHISSKLLGLDVDDQIFLEEHAGVHHRVGLTSEQPAIGANPNCQSSQKNAA
jgi:hypothetical protein